ncbi:diacylglycerol kinase family protein [Euzebya sp.]|uniref:diacylglycerol/lipid kinase family protein n=1 Tax=Euzebya sp. TaxID=1971409 RepID=UPI0035121315
MTAAPPSGPGRRFAVLVNPAAGSVGEEAVDVDEPLGAVLDVLAELGAVDVIPLEGDDVVERVAAEAPDDTVLVVVGGDGTIHRVVNADVDRRWPYLLLPGGTGNDFVGGLGIDDDLAAAAALAAGTPGPADLISGPGVCAMNAAHLGVGVQAAEAAADLKPRLGKLAYPAGAVAAAVEFEPLELTVVLDGVTLVERRRLAYVAVCNGRRVGGGTPICPVADPADGLLDVVLLLADTRRELAATTAALVRGEHLGRDDVLHATGREVDVVVHDVDEVVWNVDGELLDLPTSLTWRIQPGAWQLHRPT